MTRKQINITVLVGMGLLFAAMIINNLTKGRSGWPQTVSERGSVDVSPDIDRPSALTIEGSYDEQGERIDDVGGVVQGIRDIGLGGGGPLLSVKERSRSEEEGFGPGRVRGRSRSQHISALALIPSAVADPEQRFAGFMDYAHWKESRCGKDERWKIPGKAGELGEYRITPIFISEVQRICGYEIDVFDNASCRYGISVWLAYWYPRVFKQGLENAGPVTVADVYEMYRRGPKGYRDWLERKAAGQ